MSLENKIYQLEQAMDIGDRLKQRLEQAPERALLSDDAGFVGGFTADSFDTITAQPLEFHSQSTENPHEDTAENIGVYDKPYIDNVVNNLMDEGLIPISRFGSLNYLPINATGASEGNSDLRPIGMPMSVEKDGSLVYLRLATNGATRDVFYAYIEDFAQSPSPQPAEPIFSTRKYRPFGFPNNTYISELFAAYSGVVAGTYHDSESNLEVPFICRTNGTLDDAKHDFFHIDYSPTVSWNQVSLFIVNDPADGDVFYLVDFGFVTGSPSDHPEFRLFKSASIDSLIIGQTVTFTEDTGFDVKGTSGSILLAQTNIRFFTRSYSATTDEGSMIRGDATILTTSPLRTHGTLVPVVKGNKIRFVFCDNCYFTGIGNASSQFIMGYTFEVDLDARTAEIDNKSWPTNVTASDGELVFSNDSKSRGGIFTSIYSHEGNGGAVFYRHSLVTIRTGQGGFQPTIIHMDLVSNPADFVDSYTNIAVRDNEPYTYTGPYSRTTIAKYNGPIGNDIRGITLLNQNTSIVSCNGLDQSGAFHSGSTYNGYAYSRNQVGVFNHSHLSDYAKTSYLGTTPENPRGRLSDVANPSEFAKLIQVTDNSGNAIAYGGSFIEGVRNNMPLEFTIANSIPTPTAYRLLCDDSVMVEAKNAVITAEGMGTVVVDSKVEFIFFEPSKFNSRLKSFIIVMLMTNDSESYSYLYEVNATITTNALFTRVTQITPTRRMVSRLNTNRARGSIKATPYNDARVGPICVHKFGTNWVVMGASSLSQDHVGSSGSAVFRMKVDTTITDAQYENCTLGYTAQHTHYDYHFATPTEGVGKIIGEGFPESDAGTKLIFKPVAKTIAEFDSWNESRYDPTNWRVLFSTKDPVGFTVYFPDEIPVVILGTLYHLPATTINLEALFPSPASKTFYVFVELNDEGQAHYVISDVARPDTIDSIYVGSITTNETTVSRLDLIKVTKVGEYRVSTKPVGLGFAASGGTAHSSGSIDSEWY